MKICYTSDGQLILLIINLVKIKLCSLHVHIIKRVSAGNYLHINTRRAGLSLVTTLGLRLGSSGGHYFGGPDRRVHHRIRVADLAGHLQLVTDRLSFRAIFGARLWLVHLDDVPGVRIPVGIFEDLFLDWTQLLTLSTNLSASGLTLTCTCTAIDLHLGLAV